MNDQKIDEVITALDELLTRIADALDRLAPPPANALLAADKFHAGDTTSAYDDHNLVVGGKGE